jgi:deoxyribose-phosphate aldolase
MQTLCGGAAGAGIEGIVDTTGFAAYDVPFPTEEDLRRLVKAAGGKVKVLVNGGIDSVDKARRAIAAGADGAIAVNIDAYS